MKKGEELYHYCVAMNYHTKEWCRKLKELARRKLTEWEKEAKMYNNYYPVTVTFNFNFGRDLWSTLYAKAKEDCDYRDVILVADRICKDLENEFNSLLQLHGNQMCKVKFRVNSRDEAIMYIGPNDPRFYGYFLDDGIFMTQGFDAYSTYLQQNPL